MTEDVPHFRYHADPVNTGAVVPRHFVCACCGAQRDLVYVGPVYAIEDFSERICPWCIADGSAATKLKAEFSDAQSLALAQLPTNIIDEVVMRTPGFSSWQGAGWLCHCGDACKS